MTQLADKERTAQMNDMRSFDRTSTNCLRKSSLCRTSSSFMISIGIWNMVGREICRDSSSIRRSWFFLIWGNCFFLFRAVKAFI